MTERRVGAAVAVAVVVSLVPHAAAGGSWQVECVEDGHIVADGHALAFDSGDRLHALYGGDHVYHAVRDAAGWTIETADADPRSGVHVSLAVDGADRLHAAYYGWNQESLRFARHDGSGWQSATVDDMDPGQVGFSAAVAVDPAGNAIIGYSNFYNSILRLATQAGPGWTTVDVDTAIEGYIAISLALDSAGRPWLSYFNNNWSGPGLLRVARWTGSAWDLQVVDPSTTTAGDAAIAIDAQDRAMVAYRHDVAGSVNLARWDGAAWTIETIDPGPGLYDGGVSLALDAAGRPLVAYTERPGEGVKLARWDGVSWRIESVPITGRAHVWHGTSLALDSADRPAISYFEVSGQELRVARWDGARWSDERVESQRRVGRRPRIVVDAAGRPSIAHGTLLVTNEPYPRDILWPAEYVRWDGAAWVREPSPPGDAVEVGDLELDAAGQPVLALNDGWSYDLQLARFNGVSWSVETVDAAGDVGANAQLELDPAGRPVIAYNDDTNQAIKLARWDGSAWQVERVDANATFYSGPALALDARGFPLVAYARPAGGGRVDLYLARWSGTAWSFELVDSRPFGWLGIHPSIALDAAGRPWIAYMAENSFEVRLARWTGTAWTVEVLWQGPGSMYGSPELVLDPAGTPYVAYFDPNAYEVQVSVGAGAARRTTTVDAVGNRDVTMAWALAPTGEPMLAYLHWGDADLKLARWTLDVRIRRGPDPAALPPLVTGRLPWTDPEPVLTMPPSLLCYQAEGAPVILAVKAGFSLTLSEP